MADQIGPNRVAPRRISRTGAAKGKRAARAAGNARSEGLKAVDTIPRLERQDFEDGESRGLARLLAGDGDEGFSGGARVEDLTRTLAFLEGLPVDAHSGRRPELHEECARILREEVERARELASQRKGTPRA